MIKRIQKLITKDRYLSSALFLFGIGVFLRFYNFEGFVTFLGDQGRDAIVMLQILRLEHFPAIGPPTSIGQVYLGPFYYYLIAPFLGLFMLDPIGPAIGVGILSSLYILINYFVIKELFDKRVALLSVVLIVFSSVLIDFSRFSWNPNLLPLFTLLTIFFSIRAFYLKKNLYFFLAGSFLAFSIQLHYLALFLIPAISAFALNFIRVHKVKLRIYIKSLFWSAGAFIFFSIPLVIFDLRHNFINAKSFIKLFNSSNSVTSGTIENFIDSGLALQNHAFAFESSTAVYSVLFLFTIIFSVLFIYYNKSLKADFFVFFIVILLGISFFGGPKYPHYFAIVYPLYYVVIAYVFVSMTNKRWGIWLIALFILSFISTNSVKYRFLHESGSHQITQAKKISAIIQENTSVRHYALTALPEVYSDHTVRYFLELTDTPPQNRTSQVKTSELFVICEAPCTPIGNPLYDIARFAPKKIAGSWMVNDVTIYKLTN